MGQIATLLGDTRPALSDGAIGPASQRAISNFQEDHGLRPTGLINDALLGSLGIQ